MEPKNDNEAVIKVWGNSVENVYRKNLSIPGIPAPLLKSGETGEGSSKHSSNEAESSRGRAQIKAVEIITLFFGSSFLRLSIVSFCIVLQLAPY